MSKRPKDIYRVTEHGETRIVGPVLADFPADGGKWALYCEHLEHGEWLNGGVIQDPNRRILAPHRHETRGDGYTDWCPLCQEQHAEVAS
jgi:hypothetical protein